MIDAHEVRKLLLEAPSAPGRPSHFSAASGLVRRGDWLYVIGDDELELGVFRYQSDAPGVLVPLFEDAPLALEHKQRKAAKPDLEALTVLPPFEHHPHGALIALGSGSTTQRERGFVWALAADGGLTGSPVVIELSPLYAFLRGRVSELNIEGVCVVGDRLALFQRGNSEDGENLVVGLDLGEALDGINGKRVLLASEIAEMRTYDLGTSDGGVVFTFTDADALPDGRVVFTAAAEDTSNPYDDGVIVGSAVGIIGTGGDVELIEALSDATLKVEGVDAVLSDEQIHLLMVCDADDPEVASPLLSAALPA